MVKKTTTKKMLEANNYPLAINSAVYLQHKINTIAETNRVTQEKREAREAKRRLREEMREQAQRK